MKNSDNTEAGNSNQAPEVNESSASNVESLTKTINTLSSELETVRQNVQKRKTENTSLKVLFYTGLVVILLGFLYSDSKLQRAHMRSLERNIISLEQRVSQNINEVKIGIELDIQDLKKQRKPQGVDIFTILGRMDYVLSQIKPKNEKTALLINQVRENSSEYSSKLKNQISPPIIN